MSSILVVGAGIAGPALAHWLRRAGFATTVVERAPGPVPGGHAVDLRGVARGAVARMGLLPAVRDARLRTTSSTTVDGAGQALRTVAADDHGGDGELAEIEILRGDLARILRAASDAEFRYDSHLVGLDDDGTGVCATFADGRSERFDVVVGADGLAGELRAAGDDPAAGLRAYEARMRPWVERVQRIPRGEDTGGAGQADVSTAFALPAFPTEPALIGGAI